MGDRGDGAWEGGSGDIVRRIKYTIFGTVDPAVPFCPHLFEIYYDPTRPAGTVISLMQSILSVAITIPLNPTRPALQRPPRLLITPLGAGHREPRPVAIRQQLRQLPLTVGAVPVNLKLQIRKHLAVDPPAQIDPLRCWLGQGLRNRL